MENNRKVLLRISNLKQWFPLKKKGMYVKANDGISLDIYEGEVFGLVGESGCGKSTIGRTILQLYKQTDGRTMYYGRSLEDIAPKYIIETIKNLPKLKERIFTEAKKRDDLQAAYDRLSETEQYAKHGELEQAKKEANDALIDVANLIGGFLVLDNLSEVQKAYENWYAAALSRRELTEKKADAQTLADYQNTLDKIAAFVDSRTEKKAE